MTSPIHSIAFWMYNITGTESRTMIFNNSCNSRNNKTKKHPTSLFDGSPIGIHSKNLLNVRITRKVFFEHFSTQKFVIKNQTSKDQNEAPNQSIYESS